MKCVPRPACDNFYVSRVRALEDCPQNTSPRVLSSTSSTTTTCTSNHRVETIVTPPHRGHLLRCCNYITLVEHSTITTMATTVADSTLEVRRDSTTDTEINAGILALPQELQDHILWSTDAFHMPAVVKISEAYDVPRYENADGVPMRRRYKNIHHMPPIALQLNHGIRNKFAQQYYSTVMFECITGDSGDISRIHDFPVPDSEEGTCYLIAWLCSLSDEHKRMIKNIRIVAEEDHSDLVYTGDLVSDGAGAKLILLEKAGLVMQKQTNVLMYCCVEYYPPSVRQMQEIDVNGKRAIGDLQLWPF